MIRMKGSGSLRHMPFSLLIRREKSRLLSMFSSTVCRIGSQSEADQLLMMRSEPWETLDIGPDGLYLFYKPLQVALTAASDMGREGLSPEFSDFADRLLYLRLVYNERGRI